MSQACLSCGACCTAFRVSFYWAETDAHPQGTVPDHLTIPIGPYHVAMRGTEKHPVRCIALQGEIGHYAHCSIYPLRSTTCREFQAGDERCAAARLKYDLPPLPPASMPENTFR
jgi:uncharacterized protein